MEAGGTKLPAENATQRYSSKVQLPDLFSPDAVQNFFLQELQIGEELLAKGKIEKGVEHLSVAVAVCGQPENLLKVLQQKLPPQVYQLLLQILPITNGEFKKASVIPRSKVQDEEKAAENAKQRSSSKVQDEEKAAENAKQRSSSKVQLIHLSSPDDIQNMVIQEIQTGEELLSKGEIREGIAHLSVAVLVCCPLENLQVLQHCLPDWVVLLILLEIKNYFTHVTSNK